MRNGMYTHKTRTLAVRLVAAAVLVSCGNGGAFSEDSKDRKAISKSPSVKNLILLVSDGCGFSHVDAASLFEHGKTGVQVYEKFPVRVAMSTYSYNKSKSGDLKLGEYDPSKAWSDPQYVKRGYPDSAAAATSMSTGQKTYDGSIGLDTNQEPLLHAWEKAERAGKATGVVTSVQWSHATPAAFVAHNESRKNYAAIAREMILENATDVIMGCGHPWYDGKGLVKTASNKLDYVGGQETWEALVGGKAGGDADGDGKADPWTLVQTRDEFQALITGCTPKRVCGVAQVSRTLLKDRSIDSEAAPFQEPPVETVPTLAEMTQAAINVLDDDPDGFCLMIEGGAVDWAGHDNQSARMIEEQMDFNRAVEAAVQWVEQKSSWAETLIIVTADHETGYLTAPTPTITDADTSTTLPDKEESTPSAPKQAPPDASAPLTNNGKGTLPGMQWNSGSHTNSLVPVYAKGDAASLLLDAADQQDPVRGAYLDNTEIGETLHAVIGSVGE